MRVLMLGSGGFLGRQLAAYLTAQPEVRLHSAPEDLDLASATPAEWAALFAATRPQVVLNCAGLTFGDVTELRRANVTLVRSLVRAAQACPRPPRVLHIGSAAEYGPGDPCPAEDSPANPVSTYGRSKLLATRLLLRSGLPVVVLRLFNPLGSGQSRHTVAGRAAWEFRQATALGRRAVQFADLGGERDFVAVRDLASAALLVLRRPQLRGVLNVGRGETVPVRTVVQTLARLSGFTGEVREDAPPPGRGSVSGQAADLRRLREAGWAPLTPLEDALREVWRTYEHAPVQPVQNPADPTSEATGRTAPGNEGRVGLDPLHRPALPAPLPA